MPVPYALIRVFKGKEPYIDSKGRLPKNQARFLLRDGNMRGMYLGACLDSCRWGSETTVMYEMSVAGMIGFIQNWMRQNPDNYQELFHERRIEDLYRRFELPYIRRKSCPRDKNHKGTVTDLKGRLRCAYKKENRLAHNIIETTYPYYDADADMDRLGFVSSPPRGMDPEDMEEIVEFEVERPVIADVCYAIISESAYIMPLETVLRRLNIIPETMRVYCKGPYKSLIREGERHRGSDCCLGHEVPNDMIEFPFDGWDLAFYVQKWHEQLHGGGASLFESFQIQKNMEARAA